MVLYCCSLQLEAYESAKRSAEQAYSKSKALALQRLQSRNSQAAQSVAGAPPAAARHLGPPGPPTPEPADRSAPNENGAAHHQQPKLCEYLQVLSC